MTSLRLAIRRLAGAPGFSLAVVLTLALGIGANTLVFSAVNGLLLKPLPFAHADRLAWVFETRPGDASQGGVPGTTNDLLQRMPSVERLAVIGDRALVRAVGNTHTRWHGLWVTPGLFDVLSVAPVHGRPLGPQDMQAAGVRSMMLGYERWQQDFGADPSVVGREIQFEDDKRFIVAGILPPGLEFPFARAPQSGHGSGFLPGIQDFWVIGQDDPAHLPGGTVLVRLKAEATPARASAEADAVAFSVAERASASEPRTSLAIVSMRDHALGALAPALPLLQGFAALVLLIGCVNVTSLMLARLTSRQTELAVRLSLGARSRDLARLLLAESVVLGVAGAAAGIALASAGRALLARTASGPAAILARIRVDEDVLLFVALLGVLCVLAVALVPMLALSRVNVSALIASGGPRQSAGGVARSLRALIVCQVAVCLLLLLGAGALGTSLRALMSVDLGYQPERVVAADVLLYIRKPQPFFRDVRDRLRRMPEVEAVGLVQSTPLTGKWTFDAPFAVGRTEAPSAPRVPGGFVALDYFKAMGIPLLAGRDFNEGDWTAPDPPAIIINDVAARRFFPGVSPLGQQVFLFGKPREIVGVVKGTRDVRLDTPAEPQWYQPMLFGGSQIIVRTKGAPAAFVETLRRELRSADPRVMIERIEPLDAIVADSILERRLTAQLVAAFAGLALVLALVGIYGITHFSTTQRVREFGVRSALGARRADIIAMVLREGILLTAIGTAIGMLVSLPLAASVQRLLFETRAIDPLVMAAATVLMAAACLAACARPAWRAASVDPAITLKV